MKPQSLMKEERVLQPPPEIKPRSKTKQPQAKPRQKVKIPETENGPARPVSATSSCPASKGFYALLIFSSLGCLG